MCESYYKLSVPAGSYEADSLGALFWLLLSHRWWHFRQGHGWVD